MSIDDNHDPFAGWTMAKVGCYWSRPLPDGTKAHLSTWQTSHAWHDPDKRSGYRLTWHGASMEYETLAEALGGYEQLSRYYGALFTGADSLMGPRNDPPDWGESVRTRGRLKR